MQNPFSHYHGINLTRMFCTPNSTCANHTRCGYYTERDFAEAAELGFNFVRLPLSYQLFTCPEKPFELNDQKLKLLDQAIQWAGKYSLHVNVNLHRAPGYCVNLDVPDDPFLLYQDDEALDYFVRAWQTLTKRYAGMPSEKLTFDLLNEPSPCRFTLQRYVHVMQEGIAAIHELDPQRFIMIDGWRWGNDPIEELAGIPNTGQSCRGYLPRGLTHYTVGPDVQELPNWPLNVPGQDPCGPQQLNEHFKHWADFAQRTHTPIHCGECGCFNRTPQPVLMAWLRDFLDILKTYEIGFAWWTMHGPFGLCRHGDFTELDQELMDVIKQYL